MDRVLHLWIPRRRHVMGLVYITPSSQNVYIKVNTDPTPLKKEHVPRSSALLFLPLRLQHLDPKQLPVRHPHRLNNHQPERTHHPKQRSILGILPLSNQPRPGHQHRHLCASHRFHGLVPRCLPHSVLRLSPHHGCLLVVGNGAHPERGLCIRS